MSPAHVIEPTYEAIKRRLMNGEWAGGARLDSTRIADALGVSVTPVRDSLYRLTGERMVDFTHGEGFHVHRLTETELRDMLELNLILLLAAIATARGHGDETSAAVPDDADPAAALFAAVARRCGNAELAAAIAALSDRLHAARRLDADILEEVATEHAALGAALACEMYPDGSARNIVLRYHERRAREAATYARRLAEAANS
jgi:DNA-binding GntR family transcriptional regulator